MPPFVRRFLVLETKKIPNIPPKQNTHRWQFKLDAINGEKSTSFYSFIDFDGDKDSATNFVDHDVVCFKEVYDSRIKKARKRSPYWVKWWFCRHLTTKREGEPERSCNIYVLNDQNKFYPCFLSWSRPENGMELINIAEAIQRFTEDPTRFRNEGHGKYTFIKGKTTIERERRSRQKEVPTGVTIHTYAGTDFRHNPIYKSTQQTKTVTEDYFVDVEHTIPDDEFATLFTWFEPLDAQESARFLRIMENQEKLIKLAGEFPTLGIFASRRKKEILKEATALLDYNGAVVLKACIDRTKAPVFEAPKTLDAIVKNRQEVLATAEAKKQALSFFDFANRSRIKGQIETAVENLELVTLLQSEALKKIDFLVSEFAKLDALIAEFDAPKEDAKNCLAEAN